MHMQSLNWGVPFSVTLLLCSWPRFCSPLVSHTQPKLKRPSAWTATSSVLGPVLLAGSRKLTCIERQQLLSETLILRCSISSRPCAAVPLHSRTVHGKACQSVIDTLADLCSVVAVCDAHQLPIYENLHTQHLTSESS